MEGWKEYKLGEVAKVQTGPFGSQLHNKDYVLVGTPIVTVEHLGTREFTTQNLPRVSNSDRERLKKYSLEEGDIVYSRVGSVDRCSYVSSKETGWLFSGRCLRVRCDNSVNSLFLYYFLQQEEIKQAIRNIAVGATMPSINTKLLSDIAISIPKLDLQHKIASILSSLDDKIELNRRINANLEAQAQALFKSWFVDFEPFRDGEFVESELGMIPKGWRVGSLYDYIDVIYGAPYKSTLFNDKKEGLPLIRIRDLKTNSPQFYTPEILPNTEYVEAGDIVAGMDAEFIPYLWLGDRGVLNQRCCKFIGKNTGISNLYILFLVKPELEFVQSYKTGTTVSHLGKSDIDRFKLINPPLEVLLSFSERVEPLKKKIVNLANESRRLATLRDTLLPRLMSGEIKVGDMTL